MEQILMMGAGIFVLCLLSFELLLAAVAPTKEESKGIDELIRRRPKWKKFLVLMGWIFGTAGAVAFFIFSEGNQSIWVVGIPALFFFVPWFLLQYVVPGIVLGRLDRKTVEQVVPPKSDRAGG